MSRARLNAQGTAWRTSTRPRGAGRENEKRFPRIQFARLPLATQEIEQRLARVFESRSRLPAPPVDESFFSQKLARPPWPLVATTPSSALCLRSRQIRGRDARRQSRAFTHRQFLNSRWIGRLLLLPMQAVTKVVADAEGTHEPSSTRTTRCNSVGHAQLELVSHSEHYSAS
jgi:hypothetical protein